VSGWPRVPIRDLCESIIDCVNKTAPTVAEPTPYRMIRTTNVRHGRVDLGSVKYVDGATYERWVRRGRPETGDIILTREAPLGEVGILRDAGGVFLGQRLVMYRVNEARADRHFLLAAMRGHDVQAQIKSLGSGSTVEHMRVPDCGELLVAAPSLRHQQRIGAVLAAFDELIAINERRIELLEDLARSLYREWFVRFRFPGDRASADGAAPGGWTKVTLGTLTVQLSRGIAPRYADDGEWTIINQRCIRNGRVSLTPARNHSRPVADAKQLRRGDTLVNSTGVGTLGRVAIFLGDADRVTVDSHVTIIRAQEPVMQAWLGVSLLERQDELAGMGAGSTGQTELARDRLAALPVVLPARSALQQFSEAVGPLLENAHSLNTYTNRLATTRDLLLPRLVTGRLDIADIDLGNLFPEELAA
jgi:type I restriction enzyme S subunit